MLDGAALAAVRCDAACMCALGSVAKCIGRHKCIARHAPPHHQGKRRPSHTRAIGRVTGEGVSSNKNLMEADGGQLLEPAWTRCAPLSLSHLASASNSTHCVHYHCLPGGHVHLESNQLHLCARVAYRCKLRCRACCTREEDGVAALCRRQRMAEHSVPRGHFSVNVH